VLHGAGSVLLVTNIERSRLSSALRDVLMSRFMTTESVMSRFMTTESVMSRFMTTESEQQMINIADGSVACHKDFRLLLSSSVPLCVRGICNGLVNSVIGIMLFA